MQLLIRHIVTDSSAYLFPAKTKNAIEIMISGIVSYFPVTFLGVPVTFFYYVTRDIKVTLDIFGGKSKA